MTHSSRDPDLKQIAGDLYNQSGSYYGAAKELGNPNLRASLHRFINQFDFKPSKDFIKALWRWAEIEPVIIEAHPGSIVFGEVGLLSIGQVVAVLVMPPDEWQRHSIKCAECGVLCPRWSATQKYCSWHSWQTKEGRRYWRKK